jgi:serine/threonine protein kinase
MTDIKPSNIFLALEDPESQVQDLLTASEPLVYLSAPIPGEGINPRLSTVSLIASQHLLPPRGSNLFESSNVHFKLADFGAGMIYTFQSDVLIG